MPTIIDGLEKTKNGELSGLIACMESYTLGNMAVQTAKNIVNIFRRIAKKEIIPAGLSVLYQAKYDELINLSHSDLMMRIRCWNMFTTERW